MQAKYLNFKTELKRNCKGLVRGVGHTATEHARQSFMHDSKASLLPGKLKMAAAAGLAVLVGSSQGR